ncbi:MAG TPA: transglutaminase family protein [Candidatus Binatia bacterium]|jgi:transglutaminase-like putative cysteine protease|nr:transglutaminase family protein [Candidatus Binatia bacterium]
MRKLLYEITHTTTYDYLEDVSVSHHLLRLAPRHYHKQNCLAHELAMVPEPGTVSAHRDYFGNSTHFIGVQTPHRQLVITSRSRVAVSPAFIPEPLETPAWEIVRARCRDDHSGRALEAHEFTYASPLVPIAEEFADYAKASFAPARPVLDAVSDLTRRIHEDFTFDPTATTVTTPVAKVFRERRGVCQDFAHFQLACLRSLGLPARYVSGYLESEPARGQPKLRGVDASHAWVGFFCPGIGWLDADATNNCLPSLRHITIGWGRDYSDVCPLRGVLVGGQNQTLRVSVDVSALGPWESELHNAAVAG